MVEREGRLDQAGDAGRALGVADLRLDRAERAARGQGARAGEDLGQRRELGAVADDGAGAVRLDEADLRRRDPGGVVGAVEGPHLALLARRGQAEAPAVASRRRRP